MEAVIMKRITEAELAKELRQRYIQNPPEGMTSDEVRDMSDDDLLDMDYFLHEFDDFDDDDFGEEGFYIFWILTVCFSCPLFVGIFHVKVHPQVNFPIKEQKRGWQQDFLYSCHLPPAFTIFLL